MIQPKDIERWVLWREETRDHKPTKVPRSPATNTPVDVNDTATGVSYEEALNALEEGDYDGIGFAIRPEDPFAVWDLDHCRDPQTGEVEAWATEIIEKLNSYTEASPSGTGLHVWIRAALPEVTKRKKGNIELFAGRGYVTVTRQRLEGTPGEIAEATAATKELFSQIFTVEDSPNTHVVNASLLEDEELLRRATEANDGGKFKELFAGGYYGHASHSEAVAALLFKLAFWSGRDAAQMERLFRRSGLYYEKFDSRRGESTWGRREIESSIRQVEEVYTPGESRLTFGSDVGVKIAGAEQFFSANGHGGEAAEEIGRMLSGVLPERVEWLWQDRLALGKVALIDGDPGLGKSVAALDIAARLSSGEGFPDGAECEQAGVVLLSAEDGLSDTIRPRLDAAGADVSRILSLATTEDAEGIERLLSIPEDCSLIERGIYRVGARLVVVDPLMAFLSGDANAHRDQDVRRALAPLAALAERVGVAIVVIRHLNKATHSNPLYRGGGSIGIIGAARSAFVVAKDPQREEKRVLASTKSNLAKEPPSLAFSLEESDNGAVRVAWAGESEFKAADLLATPADEDKAEARNEAVEFLKAELADGPAPAKEVEESAEDAGITPATLRRAKKTLGVLSYRESEGREGKGRWLWQLPAVSLREKQNLQDAQGENVEHLADTEDAHLAESPMDKASWQDVQGGNLQDAQVGGEHLADTEDDQDAQGEKVDHLAESWPRQEGESPANKGSWQDAQGEHLLGAQGGGEHLESTDQDDQDGQGEKVDHLAEAANRGPLSFDLAPGESASLSDLRARRGRSGEEDDFTEAGRRFEENKRSPYDRNNWEPLEGRCIHEVEGGCWVCRKHASKRKE